MLLESFSESLMHLLLEINGQHSLLHNELQDSLGLLGVKGLFSTPMAKTTVLAKITCFRPVEKLCITHESPGIWALMEAFRAAISWAVR